MRTPIIVGNWKMYKTASESTAFIKKLESEVARSSSKVFLAVPFTTIAAASVAAQGTSIVIGAQNMHEAEEGAYTGEISARMLKEAGTAFVLLGHSERRQLYHETNVLINLKIKRALVCGLQPILCIGESLAQRESGETEHVLKKQLEECLQGLILPELLHLIIAYEPIWAIGTGKTATPQIADHAHAVCREFFMKKWGKEVADGISILYGGSVKPDTIEGLMQQPNIDGALVGGASLDPHIFAQIISKR